MIAFITYDGRPEGEPNDQLAAAALRARGTEVAFVPWTQPLPEDTAAVVIRSTWDYFHRLPEFTAWLDRLEATGLPVFNSLGVMRANLDKRYLRTLADAGVPVVPTAWPDPGDGLADVLAAHGWADAVVKPAVSGGAFDTFRVAAPVTSEEEARLAGLLARGAVLVQPFLPEIVEDGEWSLLFLGGRYSHAVVKRTRPDDFRVQEQHGGTYTPVAASPALVAEAGAVLAAAGAAGELYARVDGIVRAGRFALMELEITEPSLFLDAASADRFADALLARL